jgi:endoglucanase
VSRGLPDPFTRRAFTKLIGVAAGSTLPSCTPLSHEHSRWRGFNLQEKFTATPDEWAKVDPEWGRSNEPFREADFEWMAHWGFNFVRLPMSYRCWTDANNPYRLLDRPLREIDRAVEWGKQYGIHVCLNFHRAPGYSINGALMPEPWNLWTDAAALEIFVFQWRRFAERYRGISSKNLSFNLINEPSRCTVAQYATVMRHGVEAIRAVDPSRLILIDGLFGEATLPVIELTGLQNTIHSARGYAPFALSHYLAPWAGSPSQLPTWPMRISKDVEWNKPMLERWCIEPWQPVTRLHIPVFVGEWGCWNRTPHDVCLAWMRDFLNLWKAVGWGWALWCFRGSFGILDSGRSDVAYENWRGHKLDRKMLELLQSA